MDVFNIQIIINSIIPIKCINIKSYIVLRLINLWQEIMVNSNVLNAKSQN